MTIKIPQLINKTKPNTRRFIYYNVKVSDFITDSNQ